MLTTIFLAKLFGIFFFITGLAMIIRRKMMMKLFHELFFNRLMTFLFGVFMLLVGTILVLSHNRWDGLSAILISIIGWDILIESIFYLFLSKKAFERIFGWLEKSGLYYIISGTYLLFGLYFVITSFLI